MADVVFVLIRTPIAEVYGGEKSTIATARALAARGFEPRFLITSDDDLARELDRAGLAYDVVPVGDPFVGLRAASWRERFAKLVDVARISAALARRRSKDGLIVHAAGIPGVLSSWLGARLARGKLIYHVRTGSHRKRTRLLDEITMLVADKTIAVSRSLRDELVGTGHRWLRSAMSRRVVPIYNGFDFHAIDAFLAAHSKDECRARVGPAPDRVAVAFVGGVFADKGQLRFIERVLPEVARQVPSVTVTCIGGIKDPGYRDACDAAIDRLGLRGHVRFLGYRPQDEVFAHYRASEIAVLPSTREGLPRCAVEAQAFGLPMVATAVVGSVEAVVDGRTGFLVPDEAVERMIDPLVRLARDAELRRRMGEGGAAHVRREFSLDRNADEIAAVYRELSR